MSAQFSLKAKFGMIPKTSVLEEKESKLKQDFEDFNTYKESEELARFNELDAFITSKEFEDIKKEINAKKFSGSEPYEKEKKHKELKKSKRIKTYYIVNDSKELNEYNAFKDSEKLANYEELSQFFTSPEFDEFKNALIQQREEKIKEIKDKQLKYKELKKKYKPFFVTKDSKQLTDLTNFEGSKDQEEYNELKAYIESINFDSLKTDLENQKKEKQEELNRAKSRFNELKGIKKSLKKGDEFTENDEFETLQRTIQSKEHQKAIKELKIENLEEFKKLKEFKSLEKSAKIKNYFKFKESPKYKEYLELDGSEEIDNYLELEKEVTSDEFKNEIESAKNLLFKNTDEFKKQQEYKSLKKSSEIKQYYKFKDSEKLAIYNEINESQELIDFEELEAYINSDEFKEEKKYLLVKDKFKLSEEFKQEQEYKELKKSEKLKWFQKLEKQNNFDKLDEWELTFEDKFDGNSLDKDKWMTGYYWGKNLLNDDYVLVTEKQFFKESNISISNGTLSINTKSENVKGKVWDPAMGFYEKEFNYTSGLINTGQFFRQQFGLFKAKIKLNHSYPVHHAFWLRSEQLTPEIDVFKYGKKSASKLEVANYWNEGDNKKAIGGLNFSKDYFIYSLEWTTEKLVWKINDEVVYEQTKGVPQEAMYIVLSSGILHEGQVSGSSMEVDWVRAYTKKN
jgi:hypothetical protein